MNTDHRLLSRHQPTNAAGSITWTNVWTHVLIWVLLAVAALLLAGFTAVVDDITQRGESRRIQQRVSGSLILPDELQTRDLDVLHLLLLTGEKLAGG